LVAGCESQPAEPSRRTDVPSPPEQSTGTVVGRVRGPLLQRMPRVRVEAGGIRAVTDINGLFLLDGAKGSGAGHLLARFERPGFGRQWRRIPFQAEQTTSVEIVMKSSLSEAGDASADIDLYIGATRVYAPAGSLHNAEGEDVASSVDISAVVLDPTHPEEERAIPMRGLADEAEGTLLDMVTLLEITVTDSRRGLPIAGIRPESPVVIQTPIPVSLQATFEDETLLPWWSFEPKTGVWRRAGEGNVVDKSGILHLQAEVLHQGWWAAAQPMADHACLCTMVVDAEDQPVVGAQVGASGVSYRSASPWAVTDETGRACVTVPRSASSDEQAMLFVESGAMRIQHPENPLTTPSTAASCLRNEGCPDACEALSEPIRCALEGTVAGAIRTRDGTFAEDIVVLTTHGTLGRSESDGKYSVPLALGPGVVLLAPGVQSSILTPTIANPRLSFDLELANVEPAVYSVRFDDLELVRDGGESQVRLTAMAGVALQVEAVVVDANADPLTYSWSTALVDPSAQQIDAGTCAPEGAAQTRCTLAPNSQAEVSVLVTLTVDDGWSADPIAWSVVVDVAPIAQETASEE
jgi:hypothetical protein